MLLGFAFFTTISVLLALYRHFINPYLPKNKNKHNNNPIHQINYPTEPWFDYHLNLQLIGFLFSILGIIFAFFHAFSDNQNEKDKNNSEEGELLFGYTIMDLHAVLGLIIIITAAVIQPLFGLPESNIPNHERR